MIQDPAICTIASPQAIFHRKLLPRVKGTDVGCQTTVAIFLVHPFRPSVAKFLLQATAGKVEPTFVEKITELVHPRHPDHYGRIVGHGSKAGLALPQRFLGPFALGDVDGDAAQAARLAITVEFDLAACGNPT